MKLYKAKFVYEHPWTEVAKAHWLKYPNPFASHVLTSDVLERRLIDSSTAVAADQNSTAASNNNNNNTRSTTKIPTTSGETGSVEMRSTRLFLKKGVLPQWTRQLLPTQPSQAFILEDSTINPQTQTLTTLTRNLSHRTLLYIEEEQRFTPHPENSGWTQVEMEARIVSNFGWGLSGRIEAFGYQRFGVSSTRSRKPGHWLHPGHPEPPEKPWSERR